MKENKLIASIVVFKELLDSKKDIYDIISEFIKAAVIDKKKWSFSSTELKKLVEDVFDFKLPEAVIKSTLKNRLLKTKFVSLSKGIYSVKDIHEKISPNFRDSYAEKKLEYKKTEEEFIKFIQEKKGNKFNNQGKLKLSESINQYLLTHSVTNNNYSQEISEYIIKNKGNKNFTNRLNAIKEGVVLYTGIRYTADLNELGKWNKPLTIFLDTDILFYFFGLSGEVYKDIFNDFFSLVKEINQSNKSSKNIIQLKYFKETKNEIDNFFHVASLIMEGKLSLDPSKTAMKEIINGCTSKSDIIVKKNKFFTHLKISNIQLEDDQDYYQNHEFNIEGEDVILSLSKTFKESNKDFDEDYYKNSLKLFTKINVLRKGISNLGFENCKYIFLTGNKGRHYLARNPKIRKIEKDIPFATDIDFITDKFWFKLKKGFGNSQDTPRSFDVISKAQIVLSSQINNSVREKYTELSAKYNKGNITREEAISLTYELRESTLKPEEIDEVTIENSLTFINDFSIEEHLREKEILNQKILEGEKAKKELKRRDKKARKKKLKNIKSRLKIYSLAYYSIYLLLMSSTIYIFYLIVINLKEESDTKLSLISFFWSLILIIPYMGFFKKYRSFVKNKLLNYYKKTIKTIKESK